MKLLIVTGTPGTGKTTLAKKLARKHRYAYVDVHALILANKLHESYDKKLKTKIIDTKKLSSFLLKHVGALDVPGAVIDSHLSHYLPSQKVDTCYVTTCSLKKLRQRLKKRGYSEQKIRDNLEAEAFQTCLIEAQEQGHTVVVKAT